MTLEEKKAKRDALDKKLWELTSKLHCMMIPFHPPLDSHLQMIEEQPFESLPNHVKDVARFLRMNEEFKILDMEIKKAKRQVKEEDICQTLMGTK